MQGTGSCVCCLFLAPGTAEALQERRDGTRRVDLDDPVEVAHVDAEFEGAGRDDHAVTGLREGEFGTATLVERQRRVRQERGDPTTAQRTPEFLDQLPRVAEQPDASHPRCRVEITVAALDTKPT